MSTMDEKRVWGIHSFDDFLFLKESVTALGWPAMGDLRSIANNREAFKQQMAFSYPKMKPGAVPTSAGMLYRFLYEMEVGDYVVFPSKVNREVNIGVVEGEYAFVPTSSEYVNQRKVKWLAKHPRTAFSQGALYEIGSALSFFAVKSYADEFLASIHKGKGAQPAISEEEDDISVAATAESIVETTKDFILKELSRHLKGYDFELFIADLLNAMGYRTSVSAKGGDSGIDIVAYQDELPPRILVQVKSKDGDVNEATVQSLKGAMKEGDYGLFVTLSNYTKNAQRYLANTPIIRGINGSEIVDMTLKHYERLSDKYHRIIPLKSVYIPVPSDEDD